MMLSPSAFPLPWWAGAESRLALDRDPSPESEADTYAIPHVTSYRWPWVVEPRTRCWLCKARSGRYGARSSFGADNEPTIYPLCDDCAADRPVEILVDISVDLGTQADYTITR